MKGKFSIFIIVFFSIIVFSCKSTKETGKTTGSSLSQEESIKNTSLFIDAKKDIILGNEELAIKKLYECIEKNPLNDAAYYELSKILKSKKEYQQALALAKRAVEIDDENNWYMHHLAELFQRTGSYKEATGIFNDLVKKDPSNLGYYFDWALSYLYEGKYDDAVKVFNLIEEQTGVNENLIIQKQKVYLHQNKPDKAAEELEKLVAAFPYETRYYSLLGDFYMANDMFEKAFSIYNNMIEIDPDNPYGHLGLANYYRKKGEKGKSYKQLKIAFENENLDADSKVKILLSYYTVTEIYGELKDEAFELAETLIYVHPEDAKSFSIYGDFLARDNRFKEARDAFRKVIELDSSKYIVWEQLLRMESDLHDYKSMEVESKIAKELFPEQPLPYFFNGFANYNIGNYEKAIESLKMGVNFVIADDVLLGQFYTQLGESYYRISDKVNSDKSFEKVLDLDPNNVYVLNNYSYYLSLRNEKLDKAQVMAKNLNTINPGNPSYQDTYGWVLYRIGNFIEAEVWISKALKNSTVQNAVIIEHYGDIQYKLGNHDDAIKYWRQAAETGKASDLLQQKIIEKKLIE